MRGTFAFTSDVDGDVQSSQFQNATQTTLGDDQATISIAITPQLPAGMDVNDGEAIEEFLRRTMRPLLDAGFDVEVQHGPFVRSPFDSH